MQLEFELLFEIVYQKKCGPTTGGKTSGQNRNYSFSLRRGTIIISSEESDARRISTSSGARCSSDQLWVGWWGEVKVSVTMMAERGQVVCTCTRSATTAQLIVPLCFCCDLSGFASRRARKSRCRFVIVIRRITGYARMRWRCVIGTRPVAVVARENYARTISWVVDFT